MTLSLIEKFRGILNPPLQAVEIETTTICNRKCVYCPNSTSPRPPARMADSIFYAIIDSLKRGNFKGRVSPHFYGEPLTDDRLTAFIKYIRSGLPEAQIKLYTNGDLLTVDKYLELKKAGVDIFRISQHSEEPSDAITGLFDYLNKNHSDLSNIEYLNYHDSYNNKNGAAALPESALQPDFANRGGLVKVDAANRRYCHYVNQMTIDYKGDLVLCCNDYNSSVVFGNAAKRDLFEIWNDKKYTRIRKMISRGNWLFEICKKCTGESG